MIEELSGLVNWFISYLINLHTQNKHDVFCFVCKTKKKFYFIDTGVLNLFLVNQDSKLLENAVYLALKRYGASDIYYYKRKYETDFYIPETGQLIQVSYSIKDYQTRERELNSLKTAMKDLKINEGLIIRYDEEEAITDHESTISVVPFWKWVLEL